MKDYVHNQEESEIHNIFWILFFEREKPRFVLFLVKCMGFISNVMMGVILGVEGHPIVSLGENLCF